MSARDSTERRDREAALQRTAQRLEHIVKLSGAGSWEVDLVKGRVFWDENTRAIHEVPADYEPTLDAAIDFYEPAARPVIKAQVQRAVEESVPWITELPLRTYCGRRRVVRALGEAIRENGEVVRLVGAFEDITTRKAHEDELHRARLEAERSNVAKTQFLANMSHELRTPMAGVIGMLDAILDESLPEGVVDKARTARHCATSLLTLLNDLLDYAKLDAHGMQLESLDFSIRELLDEVRAMFEGRFNEKGLGLRMVIEAQVPAWLVGDPTRIRQVLINLVGNALKFTDAGEVRIEILRIEQETVFRVTDTGLGLSLEEQQSLFQRFVQADTSTTRRFGGTGLGLAISKQLVELMGGSIGVDSVEGEGSTFWFAIPTLEGEPAAAEPRTPEAKSKPLTALSILAAEDNRVNQMVLERVMRKAGHRIKMVENGQEAVDTFRNQANFDVILLDIQMPLMDGVEAAKQIRDLPGGRSIPIIAVTANTMSGDRERYLEAGMDGCSGKPLSAENLFTEIQSALAKHGSPVVRAAEATTTVELESKSLKQQTTSDVEEASPLVDMTVCLDETSRSPAGE